MRFLWFGHDTDSKRVRTGQKQATSPPHAPAIAPGEHERVTRCKGASRESGIRGRNDLLSCSSSSNACARNLRRGLRLRHCSLRSSATQVHQQGIQCERTLCVRRRQVAEHGRTPAVAARMPPAVLLVINLRIEAAADCCCGSSSSLLLPDSVKPAAQRGVQNSRGVVPPEAERVQTR